MTTRALNKQASKSAQIKAHKCSFELGNTTFGYLYRTKVLPTLKSEPDGKVGPVLHSEVADAPPMVRKMVVSLRMYLFLVELSNLGAGWHRQRLQCGCY